MGHASFFDLCQGRVYTYFTFCSITAVADPGGGGRGFNPLWGLFFDLLVSRRGFRGGALPAPPPFRAIMIREGGGDFFQ